MLFAEVHEGNARMHAVLTRNDFVVAATVKDAKTGDEYSVYAMEL